jgi:hypothetical protein
MKLEAICSSEMLVDFQQTTGHYIPEDGTLFRTSSHIHMTLRLGQRIPLLIQCVNSSTDASSQGLSVTNACKLFQISNDDTV